MTSLDLKKDLMGHLFWRLHYPIIIDEHNFMDIFAIRRTGYSVEFEIKVSKSDLMRELRIIKMEQPLHNSKDWTKWEKHAHYLNRDIDNKKLSEYKQYLIKTLGEVDFFIPNEFYFYVPDFLGECAVKETQGTPYGVIITGTRSNPYGVQVPTRYHILKKADKLHQDKADEKVFRSLAHGLTIRNRFMKENYLS